MSLLYIAHNIGVASISILGMHGSDSVTGWGILLCLQGSSTKLIDVELCGVTNWELLVLSLFLDPLYVLLFIEPVDLRHVLLASDSGVWNADESSPPSSQSSGLYGVDAGRMLQILGVVIGVSGDLHLNVFVDAGKCFTSV